MALRSGLFCLIALACSMSAHSQAAVDYGAPTSWLCWPGRADSCSAPLTSTVVSPTDGQLTKKTYEPDPAAPIDCFYVYPTVSLENTPNADMASGPEERRVAESQFASFGAKCRTFAPLYRQITVASLNGAVSGADFQLPYRDVLEAWRFYLAHENQGRGAVLIGHSQGAKILTRLLAEEVDGRPVQRLLISAILPGTDIQMPRNSHASGTFHHIPACATRSQIGCIIAYSTYLASDPPGPDSAFGASAGQGLSDACVNPGALIADGTLDTRLPTRGEVATLLGTTFVENPGLISGTCTTINNRTILMVTIKTSGIGADGLIRALTALDARRPTWGLHALDVNLGLGDLVDIAGQQGQAWLSKK